MMLFATRLLLFIALFSLVAACVCSTLTYTKYQNMKGLLNTAWALSIEAGWLNFYIDVMKLLKWKIYGFLTLQK
jgi:predicted CDP-diglyceride synthetase/phosphatidate cytidylyltransferase